MPASFDYAIVRVVPRVERQEFINAGVIAFCLEKKFLGARIRLDEQRLKALWPDADVALIREHLTAIERIAAGDTAGGPIAALTLRERFHWLVSARSTMIQTSPVHSGLCEGTDGILEQLEQRFLGTKGPGNRQ